jgi:hypothetical protein
MQGMMRTMLSHYRPKHLPTHSLLYQMNGNRYILIMYSIMDPGQGKRKTDGKYHPLCSLHLNMHRFKHITYVKEFFASSCVEKLTDGVAGP